MADTENAITLADLANLNTDDIAAIASRLAPAGVLNVHISGVKGTERESTEEGRGPMISFNYEYTVTGGKTIDKTIDVEKDLVGRKFRESVMMFTRDSASIAESIGLLKGRYQKVGLPTTGIMGGMEGKEPGWIDGALEVDVLLQVRTGKNQKTGQDVAYYDWLKPKAAVGA